ncbi:phytanoyl-CoA dioxygenase family protein [Paenibacillus tarimensis]|uniref:phytanoyl-CoA dioxygenase family protein n=1 Tax=Paenibacillus tarimensis TaxID=416012 RepID=UPI001F274BC7|nr:phytanoyl-CoA dioxygenase family protein [Paenibacillus tarimensis]MCF2945179.1 phytanoyl-CoA dioxygenase family protein [Paenibacillus tarimensis]
MDERISRKELDFFQSHGYFVRRNLFSEEELQSLREVYERRWLDMVRRGEIVQDAAYPLESLYPRIGNYHRYHDEVLRFMLDPRLTGTIQIITGEEPLALQSVYYYKPPSSRGLYLHQDNHEVFAYPDTCYTAWVSIDRSGPSNGGLYVLPGSHKLDLLKPRKVSPHESLYHYTNDLPEGYHAVNVETEPGDAVFFSGNLLHGSLQNQTDDQFRRAFAVHYVRTSVEMVTMYRNELYNRQGQKVRRKFNRNRLTETRNTGK